MTSSTAALAHADRLIERGRTLEAIEALTSANRKQSDPEVERALVRLRQAAWDQIDRAAPSRPDDAAVADLFHGVTGIPEVAAAELDTTVIRSALLHHGGLVVRGLLSAPWCERLRHGIDTSWAAIDKYRATNEFDPAWFDPLMVGGFGHDMSARLWGMASGTVYVADSPRLLFEMLEAFDEIGLKKIVGEYFGERPVLSLAKTAQRLLPPDATGGWHQDAAVYGETAHSLDLWLPMTRCGDDAPGLALWPRRLGGVIDTIGSGLIPFSTDPDAVAALTRDVPPVCPIFEPGDAAILDELTLHSTYANTEFTQPRYGFECWFFAPSTFPDPELRVPIVY